MSSEVIVYQTIDSTNLEAKRLIKSKNLQDPKNKRNIKADAALKKVFGGKDVVNMFEMTKLVSKHLS